MLNPTDNPKYRKRARLWAILWTLLIFFLCFIPARKVPRISVPLIDKWTHFVLFGVFAYLWLLAVQNFRRVHLLVVFAASALLGWLVEWIQGALTFLGRSQDDMDTLADALGGLLGTIVFYLVYLLRKNQSNAKHDLQK